MEKQAVKDLMYGSLNELMQNRRYYYYSSIGAEYCHWTDEGKVVGYLTAKKLGIIT